MSTMVLRQAFAALIVAVVPVSASWGGQIVSPGTGSIVGTARDVTGAVLSGVEITISGDPLMAPRRASTGSDGEYRIPALPPGDYKLSFSLLGFTTLEHDIRVGLGFTATVDVNLTLAPQREQVAVVSTVLDRHSAAIAETFDARQLADLPASRSAGGVLASTQALYVPTVEVGGGTGIVTGQSSAYGSSPSPRHTIEGIVVTGLFGAGFLPDYGSFDEAS